MNFKTLVAGVTLGALLSSPVTAGQLPGVSILPSPITVKVGSRKFVSYQTLFWLENATMTAALVRNARFYGTLPGCDFTSKRNTWITARAQIKVQFYSTSGSVTWTSCSSEPSEWPPTGDALLYTNYPGGFTNPCSTCTWLFVTLPVDVPSQARVTEWTLW